MDTLSFAHLPAFEQGRISGFLAVLAQPWLASGEWPVWGHVQHAYDIRGDDADKVFQSLPRVGVAGPFGAGYGYTTGMRPPIGEGDRVRVTVAGGLVLPELRAAVGEPFLRVLHHMIKLHTEKPASANEVTYAQLRSGDLRQAMPHLAPRFVEVLPDLLSYEPGIANGGSARKGDGSWEWNITRSVLEYRNVKTLEEYVEKTCEIVTAAAAEFTPSAVSAAAPIVAPERGPYIDLALLNELEKAAQSTTWNLSRLIALCRELNHNYTADMPHAAAAMIRTILDHIPPVFNGHKDFKVVAAQHPFGKTDKAHAQELVRFKAIADDALHRQIGKSNSTLTMDDLPAPIRVRAVLRELLTLL
ncbi:hypothetical protein ACFYSF_33495 [Streptomyces canus]|uniref:hypothetical protein n=1 Tax=Streptomyces canus TaxID=58343 RepID=UPI003699DCED